VRHDLPVVHDRQHVVHKGARVARVEGAVHLQQ
jgi:hypothetical protein